MAINILKDGDLKRSKRTLKFECEQCGCVFEADKDDYTRQYSKRKNIGWYEIECPICGKLCMKKR